jgi:hypothetical protein
MPVPASAPRKLPWLLVVLSLCVMGLSLLLMGAPGAAYAEPLQQAGDPTITQIPTDTAGGVFTLIEDLGTTSVNMRLMMEVDRSGNPVMLFRYTDFSNLLYCWDPLCTNYSRQNLPFNDVVDFALQPSSTGRDLPVLLYRTTDYRNLVLVRCLDWGCMSQETLAIMPDAYIGGQVIAPTQGPVGIILQSTVLPEFTPLPPDLNLLDCQSLPCQSTTVDYLGFPGQQLQLTLVDGVPVMTYYTPNGLAVARCEAVTSCLNPTINRIIPPGPPPNYLLPQLVALAVNASGNPIITYYSSADRRLFLVTCTDPACAASTNRVYEAMPNSEYRAAQSAINNDGDLFTAYDRIDWINSIWPNRTAYRYLMLRRCNPDTLQCTLRNLTNLNPTAVTQVLGAVQKLVMRGQRAYILVINRELNGYQISLYVGDQPVIPDPTPGPSPTATPTSTLSLGEQTATAFQTRTPSSTPRDTFTPTNTRTPTVTGTLSATPPRPSLTPSPTTTSTPSLTFTATPTPTQTLTPTFTPSSPPNAAPQRNRFTTSPFTLTWMGTAGQNLYELQIALDASFQQVVYMNNAVLGRSAEVYLSNGFYYWRVRAVLGNDQFSPWSGVDTFAVMVPTATP